ncbi:Heat-inducible transcription repressor HrcA [candidate division SR1 bacterium Aalborg_AAW-1]|nr:Heat-inducible transcription repressor HrcA [candidate division SR1 bacterium Aalborg_AAW-1]
MTNSNDKLLQLLHIVIDNYITKGEPIGSKFLSTMEGAEMDYAPSTLRKYLQQLESSGMVYQPYNSSGRIPTVQGLSTYLDTFLAELTEENTEDESDNLVFEFDIEMARSSLRGITENLGKMVDGVVVGFLSNDEYSFLGINNLLNDQMDTQDMHTMKYIVDFIEKKEIVHFLSKKIIKRGSVYYTFAQDETTVLSCVYTKVTVNDYDAIISIVGPSRVNYKKNLTVLKKLSSLLS